MRRLMLTGCLAVFILATCLMWLAYVIPIAPVIVVKISPFTAAVIRAKAHGRVDEQVFYERVRNWGPERVSALYSMVYRCADPAEGKWAIIAIGQAGTRSDIAILKAMIDDGVLPGDFSEAANHAIGVLQDRYPDWSKLP